MRERKRRHDDAHRPLQGRGKRATPPLSAGTAPKFSDLHRVAMGTCDNFYKELVNLGVTLPLLIAPDDPCTLIDAEGQAVLVIDHDGEMTNERAIAITLWIMTAINTCGGFKVEGA